MYTHVQSNILSKLFSGISSHYLNIANNTYVPHRTGAGYFLTTLALPSSRFHVLAAPPTPNVVRCRCLYTLTNVIMCIIN